MFRFDDRKEERRRREKELMETVKMGEKPKFKDLLAVMFAQYMVILPVAFGGIIAFFLVIRIILYFWGA
ncbi:MAG: hypothetical protein ACRDA5_15575 [Clostridium sp.]